MKMPFAFDRWRPRHLLSAWAAYWVGLGVIVLGPPIAAILKVTVPAGAKGSVSANFGDGMLHLLVTNGGATAWTGAAHITSIALWLAGPPLLVWLAWLITRPRPFDDENALHASGSSLLREGFPLDDSTIRAARGEPTRAARDDTPAN